MAAVDVPWTSSMSDVVDSADGTVHLAPGEAPTFAAFSPTGSTSSFPAQRSTILIHQKSPLLLATPPQITRALAYSHPFLVPLNKLLGLLSWSTDDPWESFLIVAAFWASILYGDVVIRYAGPLTLVIGLILGMYTRHFSPLSTNSINTSSTGTSTPSHSRQTSEIVAGGQSSSLNTRHHKSLDDILTTLQTLTARCNILLEPFIFLTDFLSTQRTATSSTTSPALTTLFIRLLLLTPIWFLLTLPPLRIITTKRLSLTVGTLVLTWHSRPARVSRVILWRSRFVRRSCGYITGLSFTGLTTAITLQDVNTKNSRALARSASRQNLYSSKTRSTRLDGSSEAIRFTFTLYENQRRWLGIGWTSSMLAYERAAWTDEELNPTPPRDAFELPSVDGGVAVWRWVGSTDEDGSEGESWRVDVDSLDNRTKAKIAAGLDDDTKRKALEEGAWVYTDTNWRYPRRGVDGWGKYTRRRKWVRDAELVDSSGIVSSSMAESTATLRPPALPPRTKSGIAAALGTSTPLEDGSSSAPTPPSSPPKKGWFGRKKTTTTTGSIASSLDESVLSAAMETEKAGSASFSISSSLDSSSSSREGRSKDDDGYIPLRYRGRQGALEADWGVGEDVGMELG